LAAPSDPATALAHYGLAAARLTPLAALADREEGEV
jgi:hypothetical protein